MKVSAYVRQIAINGAVVPRLNKEERHFVRQLIGMLNNINQPIKNSHTEGMLKTMLYFETCRNQFKALLKNSIMVSKVFSGYSFYHACRYLVNKPEAEVLECIGVREHNYQVLIFFSLTAHSTLLTKIINSSTTTFRYALFCNHRTICILDT